MLNHLKTLSYQVRFRFALHVLNVGDIRDLTAQKGAPHLHYYAPPGGVPLSNKTSFNFTKPNFDVTNRRITKRCG
jgi:hypothetical protein